MFDIGWSEIVVIGVVALIVIGPKELPAVLRAIGQWTTKIKRMAGEFQSQFQEAMREAEMADLKKEVDAATKGMTSHFDPLDPEFSRGKCRARRPAAIPPEKGCCLRWNPPNRYRSLHLDAIAGAAPGCPGP